MPVDPAIAPVSRSAPGTAAAVILKECGADAPDRSSMVSGVGLVPHAHDVLRYIRSYGVEPELHGDEPTWVVQFRGRLQVGGGDWADNDVCRGDRRAEGADPWSPFWASSSRLLAASDVSATRAARGEPWVPAIWLSGDGRAWSAAATPGVKG